MIQTPHSWVDAIKELGESANGEAILYNAPQGKAHRINATALEVLKLCNGERTINEIAEKLAEIYNADLEVLKKDIIEIIEKFAELKIVGEGPFEG